MSCGPSIENFSCLVGVLFVSGDAPHQGVLIGRCCVVNGLAHGDVWRASPFDRWTAELIIMLGIFTLLQNLEAIGNGRLFVVDRVTHSFQILLGMQQPRVDEPVGLLLFLADGATRETGNDHQRKYELASETAQLSKIRTAWLEMDQKLAVRFTHGDLPGSVRQSDLLRTVGAMVLSIPYIALARCEMRLS